ncbi:MAG: TetR/AcrR family transcriptional regulator [Calditrichia bacterium]|nr:TetR/AcrR family transcriptional regulator [Calditrichia bacterium]
MMPKIVDKEAKKMEILHAAMQVFAQKGVVKSKIIDIATTAGVGKGTIYEYFRSKEEIFTSAYTYFFQTMESMVQEALSKEDDPLKQLELILTISLDAFRHMGEEFADIMMEFWAEGIRNKNLDILDAINLKGVYSNYRKMIQQILKKGIEKGMFKPMDTKLTASVLIGALDGIMLQWIMDRKAINLRKAPVVLLDGFIEGIRRRE